MAGVVLDTHAIYWLVSGVQLLSDDALLAIGDSQTINALLLSPITAWELAIATRKNRAADRPQLGDISVGAWFREAANATGARIVPIHQRIAIEAADVVIRTGHKDTGDCFLIATARVRQVPLITRDRIIRDIAKDDPEYLSVIVC